MTDRELITLAINASKKAYAPYSGIFVGAAIECFGGEIFTGCNVENIALGQCICAERTALVKAVSAGCKDFKRIAVYADLEKYCMPCGSCRQMLIEFAPNMEVLCAKSGGSYVSYRMNELLPYPFTTD